MPQTKKEFCLTKLEVAIASKVQDLGGQPQNAIGYFLPKKYVWQNEVGFTQGSLPCCQSSQDQSFPVGSHV